ncbi:MAG: hypothetical protein JRH06_06225 [Deltaproteobacteria bacterium]|nr:hypothetical protein [Deltaproteobacteria bacterium]MBW2137134.1 hypothetical protein [Deltaproteobacteria bacterium]
MARKKDKKPKRKRGNHLINRDDQAKLEDILGALQEEDPSDIRERITSPRLARLVLEQVPPDEALSRPLVFAIKGAFPHDKTVQKSLKRFLFKLKQKGISIPELEERKDTKPLVRGPDPSEPIAYTGPIDGAGNRPLFLAIPRVPKGFDVGIGIANDELGFRDFLAGTQSKKRMKELKAFFFEQVRDPLETSLAHIAQIMEMAYARHESTGDEASQGYLKIRPWILENATLPEGPLVYQFISPQEISRSLLTASQIDRLLDHRLMETWIVDPAAIESPMEEIQKAKESPILISDTQRAGRIEEIKAEAIARIYPGEKRRLVKRRLEEMALVLFKMEEEQYAKIALAAAISLDEDDTIFGVNPFLTALVTRSMEFYSKMTEDQEGSKILRSPSSSNIIVP